MTISLPADLTRRLSALLREYGEMIAYASPDGTATWSIKGSVQSPAAAGLVGDMDQEAYVVFFAATDVPTVPLRMGTLLVRGVRRVIEEVVLESPGGIPTTYMLRVRG